MSSKNPIIRFFAFCWRMLERLTKGIQALIFLIFIVVIISALSGLSGGGLKVSDSTALVIAPTGFLVEQAAGGPLDQAMLKIQDSEEQTIVREVVESLGFAAKDDRIKVAVLLPGYLQGGGLSKHQVIGDALDKFRAAGKPIIAMADNYDQGQYYLAAHADEIYMHDFGLVFIEGFAYFKAYFADAIESLKIDMNVFRVGEYKSFVEPYIRNDMSEEDKQASQRWLEGLWLAYRNDVAESRGISIEDFDSYTNGLVKFLEAADGDAGQAALDAGLVDGLMSHQEFRNYIIDIVGVSEDEPDTFEQINYQNYLAVAKREQVENESSQAKVAVIVASGEIIDGEASAGTIGSVTLSNLIRQATNDDDIAAVVLRVDSPGGSMFASEVLFDQLQVLKDSGKPLMASMGSVAASGGYYISMAADEIWAAETTISGSIGVGATFPTFQRSLDAVGVHIDGIGTTNLAGELAQTRALGDEARELLDISVKSAYGVFVAKVAEARDMELSRVEGVAQGRVWIGEDAFEIGLVDHIGGIDDAIAAAAEKAGLQEGKYEVDYVERKLTFAERVLLQYARLLGLIFSFEEAGNFAMPDSVKALLAKLGKELAVLDAWNDPRGLYIHCRCEIR